MAGDRARPLTTDKRDKASTPATGANLPKLKPLEVVALGYLMLI